MFGNDQSSIFNFYLKAMLFVVFLLLVSFIVVAYEQENYERALGKKSVVIGLAEELRQSSNDLTRLARTYVSTGNVVYKKQFNDLVGIRDGKLPRPKNYNLAYWDFKSVGMIDDESVSGEKISLIDMMHRVGIDDAELIKLKHAKNISDELVSLESKAMSLVLENSPPEYYSLRVALSMLVDEKFLIKKAQLMRLIVDAERSVGLKAQQEVNSAHFWLQMAIASLFILGIILVLLIFKVGQQLSRIVGGSFNDLFVVIDRLGQGDFFSPILVEEKPGSVISWLEKSRRNLADMNFLHFRAIIESSDDAIISKSNTGVVASWNKGAEKIFGYTADEMIGKSMQTIIPEDRLHEEPEILRKIMNGVKVDHFETQRKCHDGRLIDVSVTISPIFDASGNVIGASKIARDISRAKAADAEIEKLAFYDTLTGLANRRLLLDRLQRVIKISSRNESCFALLFLDLDNFKKINDTCGHDAGDDLLKGIAVRLKDCVRETDTVSRFGGDEFVLILENGDRYSNDWLVSVLEKMIGKIKNPFIINGIYHSCTTSIGAVISSGTSADSGDLMRVADRAMYRAKNKGKNCYCIEIV